MEKPTPEQIRERSNVIFPEYGYGAPEGSDPDRMQYLIDDSLAELAGILATKGLTLDLVDIPPDTTLATLAFRVIRMLVEFNAGSSQQEQVDTASDFDMLGSWHAGPVSESRRDSRHHASTNVMHPWPALNSALRLLIAMGTEATVGLDPKVPLFESVPLLPKPGAEYMEHRAPTLGIFGELRAPGVFRVWSDLAS